MNQLIFIMACPIKYALHFILKYIFLSLVTNTHSIRVIQGYSCLCVLSSMSSLSLERVQTVSSLLLC